MSKILALGTGPLLEPGVRCFSAHGLRTWHLTKPLLDAGHEIRLFTIPIFTDQPELQRKPGVETRITEPVICAASQKEKGFQYWAFLNSDDKFNVATLEAAAREFRPDCLLGINSYPSYLLSRLNHVAPLWADLNGSVVVEGQVKSAVYGNNSMLGDYWRVEETILRRADKFSVVSMRQYYALHGELGAVGRMNRHTFSYPFAAFIPNAYNPLFAPPEPSGDAGEVFERGKAAVEGREAAMSLTLQIPPEAFILLWSGGYNSWTDIDILTDAVERAMEACPHLHYVSTGGAIFGHDDLTYPRFQERVRHSRFSERFHLLGWIEAEELPRLYAQAHLGLNVDSRNYETMFGARNRTINMLAAGLPVLTTIGAEISEDLVDAGCAIGCAMNSSEDLAKKLIGAYEGRDKLRELGARGRRYVLEEFNYANTTEALARWAGQPAFAPDNQVRIERAPHGSNPFTMPTNPIEERLAQLEAPAAAALPEPGPGFGYRARRTVESLLGKERWAKLRFLRRDWLEQYWPNYKRYQEDAKTRRRHNLEDLYVVLSQVGGESHACADLTLEEFLKLASTLPRLKRLILLGHDIIAHPHLKPIIESLAGQTRPERVVVFNDSLDRGRPEALCSALLEDGLQGVLEVQVPLDGLEETFNARRNNTRAWLLVNHCLAMLNDVRARNPGRFELAAVTAIDDKNHDELDALNAHLRRHYRCRHDFEFARADESESGTRNPGSVSCRLPPREKWPEILKTLKRINRNSGMRNPAAYLVPWFTVQMLRSGRPAFNQSCSGRGVAVLYGTGEVGHCLHSKPFANLRDLALDFRHLWDSDSPGAAEFPPCSCTPPCDLAKKIETTLRGQMAMLIHL